MPNLAVAHDDYSKMTSEIPTAIAQRKGAKLAINFCVTGDSMGLIYTDGKLVRKSNTNSGETLYMTQDGQLNTVPNSKYNTNDILNLNPVWASKGFYSIIKDGKYINWNTDLAKARHPRTFNGQDYDGNYIVGVCTGRRDGEKGMTLKQLDIRNRHGVNIVALKKENEVVSPNGDTVIDEGDVAFVIGETKSLQKLFKFDK